MIKHAKMLLDDIHIRENGGGSQRELGEQSDGDASLTTAEGMRQGRLSGSVLGCQAVQRKFVKAIRSP